MGTCNIGTRAILMGTIISALFLLFLTACTAQEPTQSATTTQSTTVVTDVWKADGIISTGEYSASAQYQDYQLWWMSDVQFVYIGLQAKTAGFVAVGIQPDSLMKNADIILGYVQDGVAIVYDMFGTDNLGTHPPDTELGGTDDIIEYGGSATGEFTIIEFKRALNTGDEYDTALSPGVNKIIWAYSTRDDISLKHINRGYGEIEL